MSGRICETKLESFETKERITGWDVQPIVSIEEALVGAPVDAEQQEMVREAAVQYCQFDQFLTRDEATAVFMYTFESKPRDKSLYAILNKVLRSKDRPQVKEFLPFIKILNNAISKQLKNEERTVWRAANADLFEIYHEHVGQTIVFWGYTSVVADLDTLDLYLDKNAACVTYFSIRSRSAADLSKYSADPTEPEMLIAAGTEFRVLNAVRVSGSVTVVVLTEESNKFGVNSPLAAVSLASNEHPSDQPTSSHVGDVIPGSSVRRMLTLETIFQEGIAYQFGNGVPKDEVKALEKYEMAAEYHHAGAQAQLGFFHDYGMGDLYVNSQEAIRLYAMSAEKGNAHGQFYLGTVYQFGRENVPKNDDFAFKFYKLSAEQGHPYAQCCVGLFWEKGFCGVRRDSEQAKMWYKRAADQGNELALRWLRQQR